MDEGQSIEEFLASIAAKAEEQDSLEKEILAEEIQVTAPPQPEGIAPITKDAGVTSPPDQEVKSKKYCTKCGSELKPGKAFCSNCGAEAKKMVKR